MILFFLNTPFINDDNTLKAKRPALNYHIQTFIVWQVQYFAIHKLEQNEGH